jgi:hypothetical protein
VLVNHSGRRAAVASHLVLRLLPRLIAWLSTRWLRRDSGPATDRRSASTRTRSRAAACSSAPTPSERCARGWRMRSTSFGQLREAVAAHLGNGKRMYA